MRRPWAARPPRERALIGVAAALIVVALYAWLVYAASQARARLNASVSALQAQAANLERDAAELQRLRAAPPAPAPQGDLRPLVQAQVGTAGLSRALVRIDAQNEQQVVAVFGAVSFADWLAWVNALEVQRIRVESARIEALQAPGLVSATATLARTAPP